MTHVSFPVDAVLPAVAASLAANRTVVLQAPPGSGKTTRAAPFLMNAPWLKGRKILLLEPRRLAARAAAGYMARRLGEAVGGSIGYHIRLERKAGPETRVEILTEGLLVQRLLNDPELADTGLVIFDEFHERSLAADTGLALALDTRRALRPDLRLAVMSATLNPGAIAAHLGDAEVHTASARMFPVETRLLDRPPSPFTPVPAQAAGAVLRALRDETGSVLVFLPGEGEIRRALAILRDAALPPDVSLHPLYGALPREEQDAAVEPPVPGRRKVVLATSIAETSLTIEGIRVVIDTGWMRVPRYSPRTGMSRLETLRVTRDRADQRRGRAGRLCPGVCYRLWDETADRQLAPEALPEILDADLAATVLQSADWGTTDREGLPWLTPPPDAAWRQAVSLLQELGALEEKSAVGSSSRQSARPSLPTATADSPLPTATAYCPLPAAPVSHITPRGRAMVKVPAHPRLAHMIFEAARAGAARRACLLAAALTEATSDSSLRHETDARRLLDRAEQGDRDGFAFRVRELARRWESSLQSQIPNSKSKISNLKSPIAPPAPSEGLLLAWAFPDRIAKRRDAAGHFLLSGGRGAVIDTADPLAQADWLAVAELQDDAAEARIRLAAPLTFEEVEAAFGDRFERRALTVWDRRAEAVQAVDRVCLGAIVVREGGQAEPDAASVRSALYEGIRLKGIGQLPWSKNARALQARVCFLRKALPEQGWPDLSDAALLENLDAWLGPFCDGVTRWSHVQSLDLTAILLHRLDACGCPRRQLDELAPTHLPVPSGSHIQVRYDQDAPYMEVRIQEVFGLTRTPAVAGGRVPVVMRLLSPAQRPVQVTRDLESFWANGYALVRKDLRGRYPKHYWPEDPRQAVPTRRVRPPPR